MANARSLHPSRRVVLSLVPWRQALLFVLLSASPVAMHRYRLRRRGMMTWHDFVVQLLLILAPAAILTLIQIDERR